MNLQHRSAKILILSLLLIGFATLAACQSPKTQDNASNTIAKNNISTESTTENALTTKVDSTTESAITEPTASPSESATTEPITSKEPATSTNPVTSEPLTTEPAVTADPSVPIVVPNFTKDDFSKTLPPSFTGENVIVIDAASCEEGMSVTTKTEGSCFYLFNPESKAGSAANGVCKLMQDGVFHYYLDYGNANQYLPEGTSSLSLRDFYIRWSFTVPEAGTYNVGAYMRLKNNIERVCQIQFDNQAPFILNYSLSEQEVAAAQDTTQGSYMIFDGVEVTLSAGEHLLTYSFPISPPNHSSWHWRKIFLIKMP